MPVFSDDKAQEKFKNEKEVFSSQKSPNTEKDKIQVQSFKEKSSKAPEIVNQHGYHITGSVENKKEKQKPEKFKNEKEIFSSHKSPYKEKDVIQVKLFKEKTSKTPEIVNQYGYRIINPIENRKEKQTYDVPEPESEDIVDNKNISYKKDSKNSQIHSAPLFQTHATMQYSPIQDNDEFIQFDFKDESGENLFSDNKSFSDDNAFSDENPFSDNKSFSDENSFHDNKSSNNNVFRDKNLFHDNKSHSDDKIFKHDKTAPKIHTTVAGGGAKISTYYDKNGNLKSKITLNKGRDRTDNKGFKNKLVLFGDKVENVQDYFKSDENEALASFADEKVETVIQHSSKRHLRKAHRYKDIAKETKKDIKQLKKEIKAEKKEETDKKKKNTENVKSIENYFNQSNGKFSDEQTQFVTPIEQKFGEQGLIQKEETVFIQKTDEKVEKAVYTQLQQPQHGLRQLRQFGAKNEFENNMPKQEKLEQSKSRYKAAKKGERKEVKKAATRTAVAKMLESKKDIQNQIGDLSGRTSGDLLKDGSAGLLTTVINTFKQSATHLAKKVGMTLLKKISSLLVPLLIPICFVFLVIMISMSTFSAVGGLLGSDDGDETYENIDVNGDGHVFSSLTDEQIDNIIKSLHDNYNDFSSEQEQVLRYALSKVGCVYNQEYHGNCNVNIFDCSSLAYRSYKAIGVNISNNGAYSAAEECKAMMNAGKTVSGDMKPGDLIFYGGKNNGRYMGIYHVAIYVGRINGVDKMVEARGSKWGVVYGDVRTSNIVNISRPL